MIKKLFRSFNYNEENFLEELRGKDFDKESLTNMLNSGKIDINYQDKHLRTFLHLTIQTNNTEAASWLIDNKININLEDQEFKTALQYAVRYNNYEIVKKLITINNEMINKKDIYGRSLLQEATISGNHKVAELLLKYKADINSKDNQGRNVIFDALTFGDKDFINRLLEEDDLELNNIDINHETIMHNQYVEENEDIALKLIEKGASTTIQNGKGETYLCKAALKGVDNYDVVKSALENGADINASASKGNNSILMELISASLKRGSTVDNNREALMPIITNLIDDGIDVNAINEDGETALFPAVRDGDVKLTQMLLNAGANPNIINKEKETTLSITALYVSALKGVDGILTLKALLERGADATIKNKDNKTLFEILNDIILHIHKKVIITDKEIVEKISPTGQYMQVVREILEYNKQDLNFLTTKDEPIFFAPFMYGIMELFKLYINNKSDINTPNKEGINLFYKFVLKVFEVNNPKIQLKTYLGILLTNKADHNFKDKTGWNVLNKILSTHTDMNFFTLLIKTMRFDYYSQDNLGRTIMHTAVWFDKDKVIRTLSLINKEISNVPDNYGILPITYAALLGNQKLVVLFLHFNSNIKSNTHISKDAKEKFGSMVRNLPKLTLNVTNKDILNKINILIGQIKRDFITPKTLVKK